MHYNLEKKDINFGEVMQLAKADELKKRRNFRNI
jgi:hypothetical protein